MIAHRPLASPLHAARAGAGTAWCIALTTAILVVQHPLALLALLVALAVAARVARAGRIVARAARWSLPLALVMAAVNALTAREGLTVWLRLGEVPPFGRLDVTAEALGYGALVGLRVTAIIVVWALFAAAVDPDGVLRLFRRLSLRSGLTAALTVRLIPVLVRDAQRYRDAQRCRPDGGARPAAVVMATAGGALERAVDVAATLEVRGYGTPAARTARVREPWSRHDRGFATSAVALLALTGLARFGPGLDFEPYPSFAVDLGVLDALLAAALGAVVAAPFSDRRGIER